MASAPGPIDIPTASAPSASTDAPVSPVDEQTKHSLEKLLSQRPERTELQDKNILRGGPGADPSLQAKQMELQKALLGDKLNTALQSRPLPEELVKEGILPASQAPKTEAELPPSKGEKLTAP